MLVSKLLEIIVQRGMLLHEMGCFRRRKRSISIVTFPAAGWRRFRGRCACQFPWFFRVMA